MKLFACQCCGQVLHFENTQCLGCGRYVGYLAQQDRLFAVDPLGAYWVIAPENTVSSQEDSQEHKEQSPLLTSLSTAPDTPRYRFCHNWEHSACNWLVEAEPSSIGGLDLAAPEQVEPALAPPEPATIADAFCATCQHNRTIPSLYGPVNLYRWQLIENAKRRLIYTLRHLKLPLPVAGDGHPEPLIFDFLDDQLEGEHVRTGHADGVITIALSEADDAHRELVRAQMGESYRTLLGHFRHEIGHYYWDLLIRDGGNLDSFTALFGDASQDYSAALERHYGFGPPEGWQQNYISSYATMHPWEDWAETWAHYLHIIDSLDTAANLGLQSNPPDAQSLMACTSFDPWQVESSNQLLAAWIPLSIALNEMNRAMGAKDIYPFTISAIVAQKLSYIHDTIRAQRAL